MAGARLAAQYDDPSDITHHLALARRSAQVLSGSPFVKAVLLGGSLTRGTGDAFSDVDLLVIHDERADAWSRVDDYLLAHLREIGEPVHTYRSMITGRDLLVYFEPAIMVEFDVRSLAQARSRWKTALSEALFDRDGIVEQIKAETASIVPSLEADREELERTLASFCVVCTRLQGYCRRGEFMTAHDDLAWLRERMLWLSSCVLGIWFEGPRRAEQSLPQEIRDVWRAALAASDEEIVPATNALVDWYEEWLGPRLERLGVECPMRPVQMHREFVRYWQERDGRPAATS